MNYDDYIGKIPTVKQTVSLFTFAVLGGEAFKIAFSTLFDTIRMGADEIEYYDNRYVNSRRRNSRFRR